MRIPLLLTGVVITAVSVSVTAYYRAGGSDQLPAYVTVPVVRGDVVETVVATGTLQAVTTVQVGSQVSGTIKALHADFNSVVRQGQVIAELDQSLAEAQVEQAEASLVRIQAEVERAQLTAEDARAKLRRARELWDEQIIARMDVDAAEADLRQADASVKSAEAQVVQGRAALNQSRINLSHTVIRAPIDGIVISRDVDVGQTVAASMSAPVLFVIARDLTRMRVFAHIDESDIGRIGVGQPARFQVDAYPYDTFAGTVSQVRFEPVVESNVTSYVTVIDVPNPDSRLKPGMTATVSLETARADRALRVPDSALRFRPVDARDEDKAGSRLWVIGNDGLMPVAVRAGVSDGTVTAVEGDLAEHAEVVTGIAAPASAAQASSPLFSLGRR